MERRYGGEIAWRAQEGNGGEKKDGEKKVLEMRREKARYGREGKERWRR